MHQNKRRKLFTQTPICKLQLTFRPKLSNFHVSKQIICECMYSTQCSVMNLIVCAHGKQWNGFSPTHSLCVRYVKFTKFTKLFQIPDISTVTDCHKYFRSLFQAPSYKTNWKFITKLNRSWQHKSTPVRLFTMRFSQLLRLVRQIINGL